MMSVLRPKCIPDQLNLLRDQLRDQLYLHLRRRLSERLYLQLREQFSQRPIEQLFWPLRWQLTFSQENALYTGGQS